jgi:hypothetical protein
MKLNKKNKGLVVDVLLAISAIQSLSSRVWREVQKKSGIPALEDLSLDNYSESLDIVYILMVGYKEKTVYEAFECPFFAHIKSGKPIAWYGSRSEDKSFLESPNKKFVSFIPDAINNVITSDRGLSAEQRYSLLVKMFSDLIRLDKKRKAPSEKI